MFYRTCNSLAMSANGDIIVVGETGYTANSITQGCVRLYTVSGSSLTLSRTLTFPSDYTPSLDQLGTSVDITLKGDVVVSGAPYSSFNGAIGEGRGGETFGHGPTVAGSIRFFRCPTIVLKPCDCSI
jgi:hypothetical protein